METSNTIFFFNHLFDLINKTDTHQRLDKKNYKENPIGFDEGVLYMSCLTNEVKNHLKFLEKKLGEVFYEYQYLDLSSGKGKSLIIYSKLYKEKMKYFPIGIEYYKPLVNIAKKNLKIQSLDNNAFVYHDDAINFAKYVNSRKLIIYLYNPFWKGILEHTLNRLQTFNNVYVIYNDPVFGKLIEQHGYTLVYKKSGNFPNRCINIYYRENILNN